MMDDLYDRTPASEYGPRYSKVDMEEVDASMVKELSTGVRLQVPNLDIARLGLDAAFKKAAREKKTVS